MHLCTRCRLLGFCQNIQTKLVTNAELENSEFIRDVRATAFDEGVNDTEWHEHLSNLYRDYRGWIIDEDANGGEENEVFVNTDELELPSIREWFRDFCCTPCPVHVTPRVRPEARERVRVLATILRATYPVRASLWGVRPANNNRPPET